MVDATQDHGTSNLTRHRFDFEGANKVRSEETSGRIRFSMLAFGVCFSVMVARLVLLGYATPAEAVIAGGRRIRLLRHVRISWTGMVKFWRRISVPPRSCRAQRIVDVEEAIDALTGVFPDLDSETLRKRLTGSGKFVWIKREVSPRQQQAVHEAGIPGIAFLHENRRFYPAGPTASHIVGLVNVDNVGIAGMEKYVDTSGLAALREAGSRPPRIRSRSSFRSTSGCSMP